MLLSKLNVTNSRGSLLGLPLDDISGGFVVKDINGLGPVKATLVSSSFANQDGEQYHSSRRESRNILIKLGLDPDYGAASVHSLRSQLYDFFMPKTTALLQFNLFDKFSNNVVEQVLDLEIEGRIESFEPAIFSSEPEVDLSIMCFRPEFVDPVTVTLDGNTVSDLTETTITYEGSVETGVVFTLFPDRAMTEFTIYHRTPDEKLHTVYFAHDLNSGDEVEISSVRGSKHVMLTQVGVESSVLYAISAQSSWIELFPGDNVFRVYAEGAPVPFKIEYTNKYGGL